MITFAEITKTGKREINEDCIRSHNEDALAFFILADGLGGHGRGEVASELAVEKCFEVLLSDGELGECFMGAQNLLLDEQRKQRAFDEMKTTLTVLVFKDGKVQWGHVGDSRLYHFSGNRIVDRTLDHSVPQMLVMAGEIREKAIRNHEDRNRLLRVLGIEWDSPKYELSDKIDTVSGDSFLLCSDGFWELIIEKQMTRFLKQSSTPERWLELMEDSVLKSGARTDMDNYSAIAVFVR